MRSWLRSQGRRWNFFRETCPTSITQEYSFTPMEEHRLLLFYQNVVCITTRKDRTHWWIHLLLLWPPHQKERFGSSSTLVDVGSATRASTDFCLSYCGRVSESHPEFLEILWNFAYRLWDSKRYGDNHTVWFCSIHTAGSIFFILMTPLKAKKRFLSSSDTAEYFNFTCQG